MKRSIIITGLMGLLLAGQSAQAANKISSVRVGFLQKEYNAKNTTQERKAQILEKLKNGGYPAVAAQLQKGIPAKSAPIKEKPVEEQIKEIKKEQQELPVVKQEVNKDLADAEKAEKALAEKQAKEREEEAKKLATLEAQKQTLEQQQGKEEEAAKKNEELTIAKQKQLEDEQRREEEAKSAEAERQRLEEEKKALDEEQQRLDKKRAEALAKEKSEQELVAILKAGNAKLQELRTQMNAAKTFAEYEKVIAGFNTSWNKTIKNMPGFTENENSNEIQSLYKDFRAIQLNAEAGRAAAGKEKEEEVKKSKELPPTPKPVSEEIIRVQEELKGKTDAQKRAFLSKQMFDLKQKGKGSTALYEAYKAEYDKLGGGKLKEAQAEAKEEQLKKEAAAQKAAEQRVKDLISHRIEAQTQIDDLDAEISRLNKLFKKEERIDRSHGEDVAQHKIVSSSLGGDIYYYDALAAKREALGTQYNLKPGAFSGILGAGWTHYYPKDERDVWLNKK